MPCLLRGHRMWHTGRGRLVTGLEMLKAHGFPDTVITSGVVKGSAVDVQSHVTITCRVHLFVFVFFFSMTVVILTQTHLVDGRTD